MVLPATYGEVQTAADIQLCIAAGGVVAAGLYSEIYHWFLSINPLN
jgi:hypothetical protein